MTAFCAWMFSMTNIRLARPCDALPISMMSRDTIEAGLPWRWVEGRVLRCIADAEHNVIVADWPQPDSSGDSSSDSNRVSNLRSNLPSNLPSNCASNRPSNAIAGFGIMQYLDDRAHLSLLAVDPALARSGVGRALLAWLLRCAEVAGAVTVKLELKSNNANALAFYEVAGFREIAIRAGAYYGLADQRVMELRLRDLVW
jgi:[ribosomal protein S18]-alanine N-acetyltransferase